jgi:hypothetical protein
MGRGTPRIIKSAPTQRETPRINHSWVVGTSTARGGGTIKRTINRDFVEVMNHETGSVDLYLIKSFGDRELVASKNNGDRGWTSKLTDNSSLLKSERETLLGELNSGSAFNRKLDHQVLTTAAKDFTGGLQDAIDIYGKSVNLSQAPADKSRGSDVDGSAGGGSGGENAPAGSDSNGSSASVTPEQSQQIIDAISKGQKARTNYESNLKYPETYEGNDFVTIEMIRYVPSKNLGLGSVASDADAGMLLNGEMGLPRIDERSQNEKSIASITLPIPANLIDANPVDWTNDSLDPLKAYGASAIGGILNSGNFVKGVGSEVGKAANALKNNADAAKTILNNEIIKQILGVNTLTRSTGAIVNPNTELLFKGPGLRTFTFSFKMTPRSQKEAVSVRKIIRTLKQGMSVKRGIQGIFLSSPNVFKIKFHYVAPEVNKDTGEVIGQKPIYPHPYLPVLKVCALQNISVNYMPDGSYMTYGDGSMVAYDMTLTFSEISPIFDDDYDELDKEVSGANSDGTTNSQDTIIGY